MEVQTDTIAGKRSFTSVGTDAIHAPSSTIEDKNAPSKTSSSGSVLTKLESAFPNGLWLEDGFALDVGKPPSFSALGKPLLIC